MGLCGYRGEDPLAAIGWFELSQNVASPDTHEIPLDVFGGQVTFIDPTSLPSGSSPDCMDVQFSPGGVSSRDGFSKVFATPMGAVTVTWGKSYVDPQGVIRNLYLDSAGNMWVENVSSSPGTYTLLTTTAPGSYAKSSTAFGREYIAISDGLHGTDIPLQYDGTNLDRVTQDGPGAPPNISSVSLPSVSMAVSGAPVVLNLAESDPAGGDGSGYFTAINMYTADSVSSVNIGDQVTIAGYGGASAPMNGTWNVVAIYTGSPNNLIVLSAYLSPATVFSTAAATGTVGGGTTIQRVGNLVTVVTATIHQLQPGYQAQITGLPPATVGAGIASVVVNNEQSPGLATVTVTLAAGQITHGLVPGLKVSLVGIAGASVGGGITAIARNGQVVTVTTATANGANPGAIVTIAGVTTTSFNTTAVVQLVTSTTTFTFVQVDVDASDSTGTVTLNWPIFNTPTPTYFEVVSAPTPTTFQVQLNYSDGSWTGGSVTYAWNGTFFVKDVQDSTTFTYQQYGPNATSSTVGKVTPYGQAAPGRRQMVVFFITRAGYTTKYSPPVQVVTNGGQYLSVTNLPIGPANVVARAVAFTGAEGAYFYYIGAPPQVNGQIVGTSTVINDNVTTSAIFDFADTTLFGTQRNQGAISVQGNNLQNQTIIEGALGFAKYGSRLITYGQRNNIQNLLNPGFDGGYFPTSTTIPTGWDASANAGGALAAGHYGSGWLITTVAGAGNKGKLSQSFYEDYTGAPIALANTQYKVRLWLKPSVATANLTFTVAITSAESSFSTTATISGSLMSTAGSFLEATFAAKTPDPIPDDFTISIYASSVTTSPTLMVDEISIIFSETPYSNTLLGSYVNNPEAFDGLSGRFVPSDDTHQVLALGVIRSNLYMLTRDPGGRIHQTSQGNTEPSGWVVDEVGQNCGTVSTFSLTVSQANDDTGGGGEEWFAWYSSSGPRIFGGEFPFKIAQEIMRRAGRIPPGSPDDLTALNPAAQTRVWGLNDPDQKTMYFGIPTNAATAPDRVWMLSYLGCETAGEIAAADPVHRAPTSGKMTSNDLGRKWSPWRRPMNGAALMFRADGELTPVFFGGNGQTPNLAVGYGNVYTLDPDLLTDDDYGIIVPWYTSYAFPGPEMAMALQIGGGLKMVAYSYGLISGTGTMTLSTRFNLLSKIWPITQAFTMAATPDNDTEWAGGQTTGKHFWSRFASTPLNGQTDNAFELNSWLMAIKRNARMPVRGSNR